jgi:hypothetical protein
VRDIGSKQCVLLLEGDSESFRLVPANMSHHQVVRISESRAKAIADLHVSLSKSIESQLMELHTVLPRDVQKVWLIDSNCRCAGNW